MKSSLNYLRFRWFLSLTVVVCLVSCGSDDPLALNDPGGGIDGTGFTAGSGSGDITGFGSVIFGNSEFETTLDTLVSIDGSIANESNLKLGMVANYLIAGDASPNLLTGTAQLIEVNALLAGLVTAINPLRVLGQPVLINSNTVCENISCPPVLSLSIGDLVTIYGFQGADNTVYATRLELNSATLGNLRTQWRLSGQVDTASLSSLAIGGQLVNTDAAPLLNCGAQVDVGDYVTVLADPNPVSGFTTLNAVQSVRCGQLGISLPDSTESNLIKGRAEGIVSGYLGLGDTQFNVGGQIIELDILANPVVFEDGGIEDLLDGVRVEVGGDFDINTLILHAKEVEFETLRLEIVAPVDPADINIANNRFEVMGIPITITVATSDEVGILSGGLTEITQLSIHAGMDGAVLVAEEIRDEGVPKFDDVKLRGPLDNLAPDTSFEILGVPIVFGVGVQFIDGDDQLLSGAAEFFSIVDTGDVVEVKGELSITTSVQISASEIEL